MGKTRKHRRGIAAVITAVFLLFILAMVACAFDIGWIVMTKTELQAAADSSSLAGGTELRPGLGYLASKTAAQVVDAATPVAVDFASRNANGDVMSSYADGARDVRFGWAVFDSGTGGWIKNWGVTGHDLFVAGDPVGSEYQAYNMIGVTLHRDEAASTNGDRRLPLFIGPILGIKESDVTALATAVMMPARGFRKPPGDPTPVNMMPFALELRLWEKYLRAQLHYAANYTPGGLPTDPAVLQAIPDTLTAAQGGTDEPLYGHMATEPNGDIIFRQDFADDWSCSCAIEDSSSTPTLGADGFLEVDIYPRDQYSSGNFGTIDIGGGDNSTAVIERQIIDGPTDTDMAYHADSQIAIPTTLSGDTGISAGFKDELDAVAGSCRAVFLFDSVTNPGNNAEFSIVGMAGIRVMDVQLTGSMEIKTLTVQFCVASLGGGIGDWTSPPGVNTTVFTPLILIE